MLNHDLLLDPIIEKVGKITNGERSVFDLLDTVHSECDRTVYHLSIGPLRNVVISDRFQKSSTKRISLITNQYDIHEELKNHEGYDMGPLLKVIAEEIEILRAHMKNVGYEMSAVKNGRYIFEKNVRLTLICEDIRRVVEELYQYAGIFGQTMVKVPDPKLEGWMAEKSIHRK